MEHGTDPFAIHDLSAGSGHLGLCQLPGLRGGYDSDLKTLFRWHPDLVLSVCAPLECTRAGVAGLQTDLHAAGIGWQVFPIVDFGVPDVAAQSDWSRISTRARAVLAAGGRVLVHCRGGCGRSGMVVLRLMIGVGEPADAALARLRACRPCAVETNAQRLWAQGLNQPVVD